MATPPTMRHTTNHVNTGAHPVSTLEMANRNADRMRSLLRPRRSLRPPAAMDPSRQPSRAQLLAQPTRCSLLSWKQRS